MEQTVQQNEELEVDLRKVAYMMRTKLVFILIITIVAGLATGLVTHFFVKPTYSSTVKMYVYSNSDRVTTDSSISTAEITAAQDMVNTYIYILKSDTVLEAVIDDTGLKITPSQLRSAISAEQATDTIAFEVTVKSRNPKLSAKIANSIAKIAPDEIVRVVKAGGVEIIDYAKVPTKPSSPNLKRNIVVGAFLGFLVSFAFFFVSEMFDTTITDAKDIEREFSIPILGTIPELDSVSKSGYGYGSDSHNGTVTHKVPDVTPPDLNIKPSNAVLQNLQNMTKEDNKDE